MTIGEKANKKGDKIYFHFDTGSRKKGGRIYTGIYVYAKPETKEEKDYNKEARKALNIKKSELTLDTVAVGSAYIPAHRVKANFFEYYEQYVTDNKTQGNRHLQGSLNHFKKFTGLAYISASNITEDLCKQFNKYLLDNLNGDTPSNYFSRFKEVLKAAVKVGYFRNSPAEDVAARSNPSLTLKSVIEVPDYLALLSTPLFNEEVKEGFIFCCYTGLRHVDANRLYWTQIDGNVLTTRIIQKKTGKPVTITLHPIALQILKKRRSRLKEGQEAGKVFTLPRLDGCNKILKQWVKAAGIKKHITWSCARLSFSILLQDKKTDTATVAYLLGHTTSRYVDTVYKRHRPKDQRKTINKLPSPDLMPYFLVI